MSQSSLEKIVNEELLRFLWRQWSQLGVSGNPGFSDPWIIDPEALLVFTMVLGRREPRLFDEVIDWTVRNGRWVSVQRLKNIAETRDDMTKRTLAAFASVIDSLNTKNRWRPITRMHESVKNQLTEFFIDSSGGFLPVIGEQDTSFLTFGFSRPKVELRNLSITVPMELRTSLLIKLRSLFGLAPRAEVIAYLMTHAGGRASDIARSSVYSHPPVSDALNELTQSRLIYAEQEGYFSADTERWRMFLDVPVPLPVWVEWPRVFSALSDVLDFIDEVRDTSMSAYLRSSGAVSLNETLRNKLSMSGIANPFHRPCTLENAQELIFDRIVELMGEMNHEK